MLGVKDHGRGVWFWPIRVTRKILSRFQGYALVALTLFFTVKAEGRSERMSAFLLALVPTIAIAIVGYLSPLASANWICVA